MTYYIIDFYYPPPYGKGPTGTEDADVRARLNQAAENILKTSHTIKNIETHTHF